MKKIVAAAAAGLILAGTAFADVSFSSKRTNNNTVEACK